MKVNKLPEISPDVSNLRRRLKEIIATELNKLPDTLEALEPEKRLNYIIKLLPYVFPRVESVYMKTGEAEYEDQFWSPS